jgi:polysaccharide biosynthesis/export protein
MGKLSGAKAGKSLVAAAAALVVASAFGADSPSLKLAPELTLPARSAAVPAQAEIASATPLVSQTPAAVAPPPALVPPTTLSGPKDYRIGPDDLLEVQVFGVDQLSRTVRVNTRGLISLPLIGAVEVGGLNAQEAESAIAKLLAANYLQNPQVSLFIKEYTSQRVTVEGAVQKPGIYPLRGETTLLRTLAIAGGQGGLSDMSQVLLFRSDASGKRVVQAFDVERIRHGEIEDPPVVNDDLIVVNRSPTRVMLKDSALKDMFDLFNPFHW